MQLVPDKLHTVRQSDFQLYFVKLFKNQHKEIDGGMDKGMYEGKYTKEDRYAKSIRKWKKANPLSI